MNQIDVTEQASALQVEESVEIESGDPESPVLLCRIDDGLFAVSGICTHAYARMAEAMCWIGMSSAPSIRRNLMS